MIPVIVLLIVFLLIAVRNIGNLRLDIWFIMLSGAIIVLITRSISFIDAVKSIDLDVMAFLFFMFYIGAAFEEGGYISHITYRLFKRAKNMDELILSILFIFGFLSALLMNDTIAIIGTPVVILLSKKHKIKSSILLLTLAFSVTIGSVLSPIGNPQNLLIAIKGGFKNPFFSFLRSLLIPTILNLIIAYIIIKIYYRVHFHEEKLNHSQEPIKDKKLAKNCKISLRLTLFLILFKIIFSFFETKVDFKLTYIAFLSCLPLFFTRKITKILKKVDWHTLVFFASMFILMKSVWNTNFFQNLISSMKLNTDSTIVILSLSVIISQFVSNVPFVALYLPLLSKYGENALLALAAGSTIAGNLTILGAASNVIIIQNAEKKGETIKFLEFIKIGIPLTILNILIYYLFLR